MAVRHALTFDIEEWFHLVGVRAMDNRSRWDGFESTVERDTDRILTLLAEHKTHATFFVLGWVAQRYPELVHRLANAGHEIASHSFWHYEVYKHNPVSFRDDLARSINALESAGGQKVRGYRAPSFSLVPGTEWALDIMLDQGLLYDASAFPARRAHGGYPSPPAGHDLHTPSGRTIRQLPMSLYRIGPFQLPFSGGGYLRQCPTAILDRAMHQHECLGRPAVIYLHPWDFCPAGPRTPMPLTSRIKCYRNRHTTEPKLRRLLQNHAFTTAADVLGLEPPA